MTMEDLQSSVEIFNLNLTKVNHKIIIVERPFKYFSLELHNNKGERQLLKAGSINHCYYHMRAMNQGVNMYRRLYKSADKPRFTLN